MDIRTSILDSALEIVKFVLYFFITLNLYFV